MVTPIDMSGSKQHSAVAFDRRLNSLLQALERIDVMMISRLTWRRLGQGTQPLGKIVRRWWTLSVVRAFDVE
ncbi:hypothetical protein WG66_015359 [Moniliophthora roreri]|nr:hypothetical protein WG66_015359 [Moniliophthora roreri]